MRDNLTNTIKEYIFNYSDFISKIALTTKSSSARAIAKSCDNPYFIIIRQDKHSLLFDAKGTFTAVISNLSALDRIIKPASLCIIDDSYNTDFTKVFINAKYSNEDSILCENMQVPLYAEGPLLIINPIQVFERE